MASETASTQKERRYVRIPSILPVQYQFLSSEDGEPLDDVIRTGFTRNLSEGGMALRAPGLPESLGRSIESGVHLTTDISLPGRTIRIRGSVAWCRSLEDNLSHMIGVEFRGLKPEDGRAIADYARRVARRPHVVRSAIALLAVALVASVLVFTLSHRQQQEKIDETSKALVDTQTQLDESADELTAMYVELRWLTDELRDVVEELEGKPTEPDNEDLGPAIDDLAAQIVSLKKTIAAIKQGRENLEQPR